MRRVNTKVSKRIATVVLAAGAALSLMGCSVEKTMTTTETYTDENPGYFDNDMFSISYDTEKWYGYVNDNGHIIINNLGAVAGSSYIEITEEEGTTASEVIAELEEKLGKKLTVVDSTQNGVEYSCFAYVEVEKYEKDTLYIDDFYNIYENNGKVIILTESITHDFDNDRAEALSYEFDDVKNTLVFK